MGSNTGVTVSKIVIDKPTYRALQMEVLEGESEGRLIFPFSSSTPARQYFGDEILSHEPGAVNFERMNSGAAPHLWNHNRDTVLGINQRGWLESGRSHADVLFDLEDEFARSVHSKIKRGFLPNVSTYYSIDDYEERYDEEKRSPYVYVKQWTVMETSTVSIPADATVGHGRSEQVIWTPNYGQDSMSQKTIEIVENGDREMPETTVIDKEETPQSPTVMTDESLQAARAEAREEERGRVSGLRGLLKDYGDRHSAIPAKIDEAISEGWPVETARNAISDIILGDSETRPPIQGPAGRSMSNEEQRNDYSLFRAIKAASEGKTPTDLKKLAPFEYEVSQRIADQMGRGTTGLFLPITDLTVPQGRALRGPMGLSEAGRASYSVGNPAQAGNLVDNVLKEEMMLDYLFNKPVVSKLGATRFTGLRADFEFPVEDASSLGISWLAEDDPATEQDTTFSLKGMTPRTAAAYMRVTRKMMLQSEIAMEPYMRSRLGIAMMLGVDNAALYGTGVGNEPRGILNYPGINNVPLGVNGGPPSWDASVQMETLINDANADVSQMGYVTNSRGKGTLKVTPKVPQSVAAGSFVTNEFLWTSNNDMDQLNGYPAYCSNQIPKNLTKGTGTDLSAMIFGAWAQLMIGQWGVVEIMTNPYGESDFLRGALKVRIFFSMDVQVGYEQAFSAITDMVTQ